MTLRAAALLALMLAAAPVIAAPSHYTIDATLDPGARTIAGTVEIRLTNAGRAPLDEIGLVLYPNRFSRLEPGINDLARTYVYPREELVPGDMTLVGVELRHGDASSTALVDTRTEAIAGWPGTLLRVRLPTALTSGATATLRVRFRTRLPERYGPFGITDGTVVALAGWYPLVAARDEHGAWEPPSAPEPSAVDGVLHAPAGYTVVAGGSIGTAAGDVAVPLAGGSGLLAGARYRRHERAVDGASLVFLELPGRHARMFGPGRPPHATIVLDALAGILEMRPASLPPAPLVVAEAPLRLELTAPSAPGLVVVSDRILRVDPLLRDFHERALATAVYAALLHARVAARERPADAPWITEGVATALADRYLAGARPHHRTVYDWIGLFNVFAIVDRFESAPKIPFARTFFPEARHADELRDGLESFARDRPPGGTIFTKLRNEIGDTEFAATIDAYLAGEAPLRTVAAERAGRSLDWLFDEWTVPYPEPLDYAVRDARLNQAAGEAVASDGAAAPRYEHHLVLERTSSRPVREPVDVEVRGAGDRRARLVWDDDAQRAAFVVTTPWPARQVTLDPDRRLLEDTRVDDARPRPLQLVLDSADVTVTSSEFGISGLFVARRRYDYRKDVGMVAFYSDRSVGFTIGPRAHFGAPIDATSYRHNLYGFYTFAGLRRAFNDDSRPEIRTDGQLGGVGVRYDYSDEFWYDNPTDTTKVRLFADLYDRRLGSAFDYADWGVRASVVRPLLTPRTLVAAELMNAFSTPTGGDRVPNQGRYSLGGDLAIRGIPVKARLGENLALARFEIRQMLAPDLDLSLADVLVLRRAQLRFFVDTGHVEDRRELLYRLHDFAVGVGVGLAAFYDFMGFYPAVAYIALAQRVDRFDGVDNRVQFLFGTRQAF
ncbi:MAG: hypothetical protein HY271_00050 [Deltaproteobacteria bacterium]|nr:hypothetical protein [Deltaproteobacteria bacterium]